MLITRKMFEIPSTQQRKDKNTGILDLRVNSKTMTMTMMMRMKRTRKRTVMEMMKMKRRMKKMNDLQGRVDEG